MRSFRLPRSLAAAEPSGHSPPPPCPPRLSADATYSQSSQQQRQPRGAPQPQPQPQQQPEPAAEPASWEADSDRQQAFPPKPQYRSLMMMQQEQQQQQHAQGSWQQQSFQSSFMRQAVAAKTTSVGSNEEAEDAFQAGLRSDEPLSRRAAVGRGRREWVVSTEQQEQGAPSQSAVGRGRGRLASASSRPEVHSQPAQHAHPAPAHWQDPLAFEPAPAPPMSASAPLVLLRQRLAAARGSGPRASGGMEEGFDVAAASPPPPPPPPAAASATLRARFAAAAASPTRVPQVASSVAAWDDQPVGGGTRIAAHSSPASRWEGEPVEHDIRVERHPPRAPQPRIAAPASRTTPARPTWNDSFASGEDADDGDGGSHSSHSSSVRAKPVASATPPPRRLTQASPSAQRSRPAWNDGSGSEGAADARAAWDEPPPSISRRVVGGRGAASAARTAGDGPTVRGRGAGRGRSEPRLVTAMPEPAAPLPVAESGNAWDDMPAVAQAARTASGRSAGYNWEAEMALDASGRGSMAAAVSAAEAHRLQNTSRPPAPAAHRPRGKFDSGRQRLRGTEAARFVNGGRGTGRSAAATHEAAVERAAAAAAASGSSGKADWREQSAAFREAMRAAKAAGPMPSWGGGGLGGGRGGGGGGLGGGVGAGGAAGRPNAAFPAPRGVAGSSRSSSVSGSAALAPRPRGR